MANPEITGPATCPECGTGLRFRSDVDLPDLLHTVLGGELVILQDFPAEVFCPEGHHREDMIASQFTIDIATEEIVYARFRKIED